jgi:hypothetical protein
MLTISVKVSGLDTFPGQPEIRKAIRTAIAQAAYAIRNRAEQNLSGRFVAIRTGKLRRGMRVNLRETPQAFVATVRNIVFYGQILEGGAKSHLIPKKKIGKVAQRRALARAGRTTLFERRPGEAAYLRGERIAPKVLRFEAGGKTIFARSVVHPGLRPRRWFASAVQEALPDLQRIFEQELGAAVTKGPLVIA